MSTETIKDKKLANVLQKAVEFENTKAKQKSCFYCGEKFGIEKNFDLARTEEIPDEWTCSKGHTITSRGWEWHDVASNYSQVRKLLAMDLVKIKYKSNKHTDYCLSNRKQAIEILNNSTKPKNFQITNSHTELFSDIIGHDDIKKIIGRTLLTPKPSHLLLVGPPASAKTMFQIELESMMPDAFFVDGANLTGPGLVDLLFDNDVRYLIIDEIEEMKREDLGVLTSFMQTGRLYETKYMRTRTKEMNVSIIGSCNDTSKISQKLVSRFLCVHFQEYRYEEFASICASLLGREGIVPILSDKISKMVWNDIKSRDIRDALKISYLVKNEEDLKWVLEMFQSGILASQNSHLIH